MLYDGLEGGRPDSFIVGDERGDPVRVMNDISLFLGVLDSEWSL